MIEVKIWSGLTGVGVLTGLLAQATSLDITAATGYATAICLAAVSIYTAFRKAKREQDIADKDARKNDIEERLWAAQAKINELQSQADDLKSILKDREAQIQRWIELCDQLGLQRKFRESTSAGSSPESPATGKSAPPSSAASSSSPASPPSSTAPSAPGKWSSDSSPSSGPSGELRVV